MLCIYAFLNLQKHATTMWWKCWLAMVGPGPDTKWSFSRKKWNFGTFWDSLYSFCMMPPCASRKGTLADMGAANVAMASKISKFVKIYCRWLQCSAKGLLNFTNLHFYSELAGWQSHNQNGFLVMWFVSAIVSFVMLLWLQNSPKVSWANLSSLALQLCIRFEQAATVLSVAKFAKRFTPAWAMSNHVCYTRERWTESIKAKNCKMSANTGRLCCMKPFETHKLSTKNY